MDPNGYLSAGVHLHITEIICYITLYESIILCVFFFSPFFAPIFLSLSLVPHTLIFSSRCVVCSDSVALVSPGDQRYDM